MTVLLLSYCFQLSISQFTRGVIGLLILSHIMNQKSDRTENFHKFITMFFCYKQQVSFLVHNELMCTANWTAKDCRMSRGIGSCLGEQRGWDMGIHGVGGVGSEAVLAIRPGRSWPTQTRSWPTQMARVISMFPAYTASVGPPKICLAFDWPTQMKISRTASEWVLPLCRIFLDVSCVCILADLRGPRDYV